MTAKTSTENKFAVTMNMGGAFTAGVPTVKFSIPSTQLQVPTIDVQDVVATTINFSAQGTDGSGNYDIGADNEMTVDYYNTSSTP
jgi:hypothetical protein